MVVYESRVIGEVRATSIGGQSGVGMSQLCFSLAWSIYPRSTDVFTVFGTSIWVSVSSDGHASPLMLGHAIPETAWCEESREGQPYDRQVMYRLTLPSPQVLAIEQLRQGGRLVFWLDVRGNSNGPRGVRTIEEKLQLAVTVSDWVRVLKDLNAAEVLLVGVHLPVHGLDRGARAAIDLVRRANEHLEFGHYSAAVAECRRAIESLWKSAKLEDQAREARKLLSTMKEQKSMTKRGRELALGEAVRIFAHTAHHVGADAEPEVFGRVDAALVVAATAGLVSSLISSQSAGDHAAAADADTKGSSGAFGSQPQNRSVPTRVEKAIEVFRNRPANRPRTIKGLRSFLGSLFNNRIEKEQLDELIQELLTKKVIAEAGGKLTYTQLE